jgi:putative hydrolase of HD superfamily
MELNDNNVAKYLYELGYLKHLNRAGWSMIGVPNPESVAEHSFRTAILGYVLASMEGADPLKTAVICLFHDTGETRIGDLHRVAKRYINVGEGEAAALKEQVQRLPPEMGEPITALTDEYEQRASPEGKIARDADLLECLIQAREYQENGHIAAQDWITGCYEGLQTASAQRLAQACMQLSPQEWWKGLKVGN